MSEWFVQLGYEGQLATWLVASFFLYTLASQLVWQSQWLFLAAYLSGDARTLTQSTTHYEDAQVSVESWTDHLIPWAIEVIRFVYYLGLPFLVTLNGLLGADLLGLRGTNVVDGRSVQGFLWEDWVQGLGLAVAALMAMVGVWVVRGLVSRRAGLAPGVRGIPGPLWQRLLDVLYYQVHWAFYRSGPILWLEDVYWGTFAGLALVWIEAGLNPAFRWQLRSSETASLPLFQIATAWISALLFLGTQNLWLTTAVHLVLVLLVSEKAQDRLNVPVDEIAD